MSCSQLKGVIVPQNQNDAKRISQLEQENKELRRTLVESKKTPSM